MGKLIVSMMTSLDGYVEGPARELDWPVESAGFNAYCDEMIDHTDTLLFGRVSYEMMVAYWPAAETAPRDDWERDFARRMNTVPKLVLSRTLAEATWRNTRVVRDHVGAELEALKRRAAKDCFVFGGAGVIASLRQLGLIDEYRVIVNPVVLGRGTPLFTDVEARVPLTLVSTRTLDGGPVVLTYRPA